jgi:hypothetical protein
VYFFPICWSFKFEIFTHFCLCCVLITISTFFYGAKPEGKRLEWRAFWILNFVLHLYFRLRLLMIHLLWYATTTYSCFPFVSDRIVLRR